VVFTNGCYDLLHPGHVRLLEQARSLGDVLILALNSDASVRRMKGLSRPLIAENERAAMALALSAVDAVTLFDEDTPRELIAEVLPDVLVKGADWSHFIAGREEVEAAGFVLDAESTMLANKDDPHSIKVFDPSIKGETDRFAYRFVKP